MEIDNGNVGEVKHKFERAGLGKAPFKFVGMEVKLFQAAPGEPVRAGSSCDYCATAIANCYWILSADGKRFKVGCDCIAKIGDAGLVKQIDRVKRDHEKKLADERAKKKIQAALDKLPSIEQALKSMPHPRTWLADKGLTRYDWVTWMFEKAGRKGQLEAAKYISEF